MARAFHALFPESELFLLRNERHFVQLDEPAEVARLILSFQPQKARAGYRDMLAELSS